MMSKDMGNFGVLIVDDHPAIRVALRDTLQYVYPGAKIVEAGDGASAVELCGLHRPRLVLMDIGLTDADGIELTARVKALLPECKVIVVSQHTERIYAERAQQAGACAYITKGTAHRELLPAVARALAPGTPPDTAGLPPASR